MATASTASTTPKRVFIFDNPRSRSHLFYRLISTHPEFKTTYHPYVNSATLGPGKIHYNINESTPLRAKLIRESWEPMCQESFTLPNAERKLIQDITHIESDGKIPLINEHCCYMLKPQIHIDHVNSREPLDASANPSNPTVLPDDIWESLTPIVLIRHPALAIPSLYRSLSGVPSLVDLDPTENQNYLFATLSWSRLLFDTLQRHGRRPIVVDGEDVCTRTQEVINAVCDGLGLDPSGVEDTWEPWGPEALAHAHPIFTAVTRTIWESDGIRKYTPTGPVSIDNAVAKIESEYGAKVADKMRIAINMEMDNYRYLEQFKV